MKPRRSTLLAASALLCMAWLSPVQAEPPRKAGARAEARSKRARGKARKERRRATEAARAEHGKEPAQPKPEAPNAGLSAAQKAAQDAAQGVNAQIVKEGDTSVKMMTFTGLDIEGRLKSPQLLYFVNRVHAEFDRPKLPHRSFMPELRRSSEREPLR